MPLREWGLWEAEAPAPICLGPPSAWGPPLPGSPAGPPPVGTPHVLLPSACRALPSPPSLRRSPHPTTPTSAVWHTCYHDTPGTTQAEPAQGLLVHPELLGPKPARMASLHCSTLVTHAGTKDCPRPWHDKGAGDRACRLQLSGRPAKVHDKQTETQSRRPGPVCSACTSAPAPGRRSSRELCWATPPPCQQIRTKRTCLH